MTTPQTAAARPAALPADLTVDETVRIADAITAAHADSTRTVYAWAWSQWERWCAGRGATAMPAEPAMICAYLTERAAAGLSVGTIDLACGAISYRHRMHGLPDPILTEGMRQVRRGLRRIIGAAPRRQARPLGTDDIRTIVESIDRSTALGAHRAHSRPVPVLRAGTRDRSRAATRGGPRGSGCRVTGGPAVDPSDGYGW